MNKETALPLAKTIIRQVLRIKHPYTSGGGTQRSRYCYSVWMRHLNNWSNHKSGVPSVVAELGPGNSLGIGFCALLSGSEQLNTLDVVQYWDTERNLKMFNELVTLFKSQIDIPGNEEFPRIKPALDDDAFPSDILTEAVLKNSLNENRLDAIRSEIKDLDNPENKYIKCHVPWYNSKIILNNSVDLVYSQSVLQYIDDIDGTFSAMKKWLKPKGLMSHSIDFSSIGLTKNWNSHWTFSDLEWKIMKAGKDFIITRRPFSFYLTQNEDHGFKVLEHKVRTRKNSLAHHQLARAFRDLSDSDMETCGAYILSQKV
ncbi:methyltransferase domain-containing protein [Winogradskyella tangerina]|uniref:methyltransferase domain-containing protein n=1 Tax=Winogradskyella tangerina TaxID=2023240 RepID=UPI000DBE38D2|nr:methyltransferase domain-containing protein [Winogradskyella tangerina]